MISSCCGRMEISTEIDRVLAQDRRNRRRAAAPDDLGEVDHQQADRERAHHPHVAARPQERQDGEPLGDEPEQEQRDDHRRQHDQRVDAVQDEQRIGEHPAQHHPHAEREVEHLRGHEGEAVSDRDQSVDRAGRDPARGDLQEEIHVGRLIAVSGRATTGSAAMKVRRAPRTRSFRNLTAASDWTCRGTSWSGHRSRHRARRRRT